jgi:transcriptional regulator with XRE-family HTH domain
MLLQHNRIEECLTAKEWSQEDLLLALAKEGQRVSRPTIAKWISGKSIPDANELAALSIIFGKTVKYFFGQ